MINSRSGRKKIDHESIISNWARNSNRNVAFFRLGKKNTQEKLKETIQKQSPEIVVAVGGDGTVSLVADSILASNIKMGIIPAGSANGMARELQIPEDTQEALEVIASGNSISSDMVIINNKWLCLHLSDLGLNARVVKYFEEGRVRGFIGYAIALFKALRRKNDLRTTIHTPQGKKTVNALMVIFANASKYGTGATINFDCSLTDRLFEVVIVKKIGPSEVWKMFFGKRGFDPANIEVHSGTRAVVQTTRPAHLQVDGEYLGKVRSVEAAIHNRAIKVLVPENKKETEEAKTTHSAQS